MGGADWLKIKNDYINTSISYRKLAEKYKVSFSTLQQRAKKEHWADERDRQCDMTMTKMRQKTTDVIVKKEVDRIARITSLADRLIEKLEQATDQLDNYIVTNKVKVKTVEYDNVVIGKPQKEVTTETENLAIVDGVIDRAGLKKLSSALKDLKDIQTIAKKENDTDNNSIKITLEGELKEWAK